MTKVLVQYAKDGKEWQEEHEVPHAKYGRLEDGSLTLYRELLWPVAVIPDVRGWRMADEPAGAEETTP